MSKERNIATLPLDGGVLCFDFINTVNAWRGVNLHEYLGSYTELIQWCAKVGILSAKRRKQLQQYASGHPEQAAKTLEKIKRVRELLYRVFSTVAAGNINDLSGGLLHKFNTVLSASLSHVQVTIKGTAITSDWQEDHTDLLQPLWIVMKSAYDVIIMEDQQRIKECSSCGWIFLDHTKNNKRRWCNPLSCGSIEKSKKYYRKKKQEMLDT